MPSESGGFLSQNCLASQVLRKISVYNIYILYGGLKSCHSVGCFQTIHYINIIYLHIIIVRYVFMLTTYDYRVMNKSFDYI